MSADGTITLNYDHIQHFKVMTFEALIESNPAVDSVESEPFMQKTFNVFTFCIYLPI